MITVKNGRVINDDGLVAIRKFPPMPQLVQIPGGAYVFSVERNVCLSWVSPKHVDALLNLKKTCCGGQSMKQFRLADEPAAKAWLGLPIR